MARHAWHWHLHRWAPLQREHCPMSLGHRLLGVCGSRRVSRTQRLFARDGGTVCRIIKQWEREIQAPTQVAWEPTRQLLLSHLLWSHRCPVIFLCPVPYISLSVMRAKDRPPRDHQVRRSCLLTRLLHCCQVMEEIVQRTASAMVKKGVPFTGVLFAGLMIKDGRVSVTFCPHGP